MSLEKNIQTKPSSILQRESLFGLNKGTPVDILYATTPTKMIYFGKTYNPNECVQLIEIPANPQQQYSMFSVYVVPVDSLFSNGEATLYPSEQKLPRRVLKWDSDFASIDAVVKEYDNRQNRIQPPAPTTTTQTEDFFGGTKAKLNTGTERFGEYDEILKELQKFK